MVTHQFCIALDTFGNLMKQNIQVYHLHLKPTNVIRDSFSLLLFAEFKNNRKSFHFHICRATDMKVVVKSNAFDFEFRVLLFFFSSLEKRLTNSTIKKIEINC